MCQLTFKLGLWKSKVHYTKDNTQCTMQPKAAHAYLKFRRYGSSSLHLVAHLSQCKHNTMHYAKITLQFSEKRRLEGLQPESIMLFRKIINECMLTSLKIMFLVTLFLPGYGKAKVCSSVPLQLLNYLMDGRLYDVTPN